MAGSKIVLLTSLLLIAIGLSVEGVYGLPFSTLGTGQAFANGQVALILNGNQCTQSSTQSLSPCGQKCFIYQCQSLPSASPGVVYGTTDSSGNVQFAVTYTTGSGYGYSGCGYGPWAIAPFYELAAYINGQWQLQSEQFYIGINGPWCTNPSNPSFPLQYAGQSIADYSSANLGYWSVNVSICNVSCSSPPTTTVTQTTVSSTTLTTTLSYTSIVTSSYTTTSTYTTTVSGTTYITTTTYATSTVISATTGTVTSTITQPVIQATTMTVNGPTTTETIVSTQYSTSTVQGPTVTTTVIPQPVTTTQTVVSTSTQTATTTLNPVTTTATQTVTGPVSTTTASTTFTQTLTGQGTTTTVTQTVTAPSPSPVAPSSAASFAGFSSLALGVIFLGVWARGRRP